MNLFKYLYIILLMLILILIVIPSGGYLRCALSASWVTMGPDTSKGFVRHSTSPAELS